MHGRSAGRFESRQQLFCVVAQSAIQKNSPDLRAVFLCLSYRAVTQRGTEGLFLPLFVPLVEKPRNRTLYYSSGILSGMPLVTETLLKKALNKLWLMLYRPLDGFIITTFPLSSIPQKIIQWLYFHRQIAGLS